MGVDRQPRLRAAPAALALLALAVAGCASSHGAGSTGGRTGSPPASKTIRLTPSDDGGTARAVVGETLVLTLPSTYWRIARAVPRDVLDTVARATRPGQPRRSCVPGQGCGTASARFRALHTGRATISARRTACGEALACRPAQAGYRVTIVVRPAG